jgi:hypothetical protein
LRISLTAILALRSRDFPFASTDHAIFEILGIAYLAYFTNVKYSELQKSYCRGTSPKGKREVRLPKDRAAFEFGGGRPVKPNVPMYLEGT